MGNCQFVITVIRYELICPFGKTYPTNATLIKKDKVIIEDIYVLGVQRYDAQPHKREPCDDVDI